MTLAFEASSVGLAKGDLQKFDILTERLPV